MCWSVFYQRLIILDPIFFSGQKKVYGCALSNRKDEGEEEGGGGGEGGEGGGGGRGGGEGGGGRGRGGGPSNYPKEAEGFLFAPSDVTPWEVEGKDDMHGIGYHGIRDQGVLGARKSTKSLYGMSGEVGVVNSRGGSEIPSESEFFPK